MSAAPPKILLVDDDGPLLGLLSSLLEQEGYAVETVHGLAGFTPELMALAHPRVVFLNPRLAGMDPTVMKGVLEHFRRLTPKATLIFIGDGSLDELKSSAAELKADGVVPTAQLLRNPSEELRPMVVKAVSPPVTSGRPRIADLAPEAIQSLELEMPDHPAPRPAPPRFEAPAGVSLTNDLVKLIEEEMDLSEEEAEPVQRFEVPLDVLTEHNLYGPGPGVVRGVFVAAAVRPQSGSTVELLVSFPWGTRYEISGTVEWTLDLPRLAKRTRGGFGVKLPELSPLQKSMFNRFMGLRQPMVIASPPRQ